MFEKDFDPAVYVAEYYSKLQAGPYWDSPKPLETLGQENSCLLEFYARIVLPAIRQRRSRGRLLEVGGGPVIYQLISACPAVETIVFSEFLQKNLDWVDQWRQDSRTLWHRFIEQAIFWETGALPAIEEVLAREHQLKEKIRLARYDVLEDRWLTPEPGRDTKFDIVSSNFCLESITDLRWQWRAGLANLCSLVSPAGLLIMTALAKSQGYRIGRQMFPAVSIQESDIRSALEQEGFGDIQSWTRDSVGNNSGYRGLIFTLAQRKT